MRKCKEDVTNVNILRNTYFMITSWPVERLEILGISTNLEFEIKPVVIIMLPIDNAIIKTIMVNRSFIVLLYFF